MKRKSAYRSILVRSSAAFLLLAALSAFPLCAARAEETSTPTDLTNRCTVRLPEDSAAFAARLSDNRYNSRISFSKEETLEISLAEGAKGLYIAWYTAPVAVTNRIYGRFRRRGRLSAGKSGPHQRILSAAFGLQNSPRLRGKNIFHLRTEGIRFRDAARGALHHGGAAKAAQGDADPRAYGGRSLRFRLPAAVFLRKGTRRSFSSPRRADKPSSRPLRQDTRWAPARSRSLQDFPTIGTRSSI